MIAATERSCAAATEPDVVARCHVLTLETLQDGELILLDLRPHGASVVIRPAPLVWAGAAAVVLLGALAGAAFQGGMRDGVTVGGCGLLILLVVQVLDLRKRRFILTDRRVISLGTFGCLEMPLSAVRRVRLTRSRSERFFDLGTLLFEDHAERIAVRWEMLGRPLEVHRAVEDAIERYARGDFVRDGRGSGCSCSSSSRVSTTFVRALS